MSNLLAPQALAPGQPSPGLLDPMQQQHQQYSALYQKSNDTNQMFAKLKAGLDSLLALGDGVQPEDVIKEAGTLVAAGADPHNLAAQLATMPTSGGQALAGWVQQQDQAAAANLAKQEPSHAALRHELGVSALRVLAAHHFEGGSNAA